MLPSPGRSAGIRSRDLRDGESDHGLGTDAGSLLGVPRHGEARRWTAEALRWRLRRPGARYALHRGEGLLAVSCHERRAGVRVAIILKVFAAAPLSPHDTRALVRAACRHHRAPAALHVGLNDLVDFRGVALPRRLRASPLNLIYRSLLAPPRDPAVVRFEFLDFDAY